MTSRSPPPPKLSTSITRKHPDVILWTRVGGLRGVNAVLLRRQLPGDVRQRLDARVGECRTAAPVHRAVQRRWATTAAQPSPPRWTARGLLPG